MSQYHTKPTQFVDHVNIKVKNLEQSVAFYQTMIGFQILEKANNTVSLTADGIKPLVTLETSEDIIAKQRRTTGLYHFALLLPTLKDLGKLLKHLIEAKYPLEGASYHGMSNAIYLADPDGNGIEICVDTDPSTWFSPNGKLDISNNGPMDIRMVLMASNHETFEGLPSETRMGHIHLHVSEFAKIKEFYVKGLGFEITIEIPNQAVFFASGGYHHHIGTNVWNGVGASKPSNNSVGLSFYTIVLPNEEERAERIKRLIALGYEVEVIDQEYYTEDPSGNRICLKV